MNLFLAPIYLAACSVSSPMDMPQPLLNLNLINIPKHIKLQYIKVIILVSFKIDNRENPMNRINQLFTSTMLKSHLKFKSPKIKEIINKHIKYLYLLI